MILLALVAFLSIPQVSSQYVTVPVSSPTTKATTVETRTSERPTLSPTTTTTQTSSPLTSPATAPPTFPSTFPPSSPATSQPTFPPTFPATSQPTFSSTFPPTSQPSFPSTFPPTSIPTSPVTSAPASTQTPGPTQTTQSLTPITSSPPIPITLTPSGSSSNVVSSTGSATPSIATPSSVAVSPSTSTASGPGGGPGTGPGSGYGEGGDGSSPGHSLSRQSKLVIIIIGGTLGLMALICVVSYLVPRQRQKRLRRVGRGGMGAPFLANDGFIKLSTAMAGEGGKRESDLTEHEAGAMRESRGPNLIHEELGQERHRSWHDPQSRPSSESKRSVSKAMMSSRRTSMVSSRRSSFQNMRRTSCAPQGSSPSMEEDVLFFGAGGIYTPDTLNGPHKVIGGSQASSLSCGGRESRTFLRDSESYHDDRRSWNTNSSRVSLGGSSTASDAYLLPRDVFDYDEGERIQLEEQVVFIKAQHQDMDRQRHVQQLWLDQVEGLLKERSECGGEYLSRTLLESDDPLSKSSTMDGEESKRSFKMHEEEEEVDEHIDMSDLGTSRPLSLDQESIVSKRLTHNISPTTTAFTGELEYL